MFYSGDLRENLKYYKFYINITCKNDQLNIEYDA